MRKIKFRWKDKQGKTFYSTFDFSYGALSLWTSLSYHGEIDEESVAQLVGYDADGNEVYEGDILVNEKGGEFQASFKSVITSLNNPCYCRYLENLEHRKYYRLKG